MINLEAFSKSRATPEAARPRSHSSSEGKGCHARGAVGKRRAEPRRGGRGVENTATVSGCRHGGAARRVILRHVASRPLRRTDMSTPVPTWGHRCRHVSTIGRWSPCGAPRSRYLPRRPCCRAPGREGPGPGRGLAQNLHKVGPASGRHRRGRRPSCRTGAGSDLGPQAGARPPAAAGRRQRRAGRAGGRHHARGSGQAVCGSYDKSGDDGCAVRERWRCHVYTARKDFREPVRQFHPPPSTCRSMEG